MENSRNCPICKKEIFYSSKKCRDRYEKIGTSCRSCGTKKQYISDPGKNKGESNGMHNRSLKDVWIEKFGEEGEKRFLDLYVKREEKNFLIGRKTPSVKNSSISWSGNYGKFHFRSLLELSFILKMENLRIEIETAENSEFFVKYSDENGVNRIYRPDFVSRSTREIFEIKPSILVNLNKAKFEAAEIDFKRKNFTFKIITEKELIDRITVFNIKPLIDNKKVILDQRTFVKFEKLFKI